MFERPVRTKSELIYPSNDVSFTLAIGRQTARPVLLSRPYWLKIVNFPHPLSFNAIASCDPFRIYERVLRILGSRR